MINLGQLANDALIQLPTNMELFSVLLRYMLIDPPPFLHCYCTCFMQASNGHCRGDLTIGYLAVHQ